jgi:serine/threonine-protein kinase
MAAVGAYQATAATALARPHADVLVTEPPALVEEPVAYPPEHEPPRWPWIALIIVALLIAGGVAAFLLTRPQKDIVPGVVGKDLNTASTIVQNAGFDVSTINVPSARRSGTVIRQSPQPGVKANDGSTVSLVVSSGPGNTVVPGVANLSLARAKRAIVAQHLTIGAIVHQNSDTVPSGQVISTQPGAGQSVPVGAPIELFVSSGRAKVAVPDVTGESESDARAALTQAGLKVTSSPQTSSTVQAGDVISETPSAGTRVAPGTTVSLVVASAPTTAQVPDERNQTPAQAASALTQAGFAVQQRNRNVSDPARDGIVLAMDPPAGTTLKKGSTVTIVVGHLKSSSSSSSSSSSTSTTSTTSTTATTP